MLAVLTTWITTVATSPITWVGLPAAAAVSAAVAVRNRCH